MSSDEDDIFGDDDPQVVSENEGTTRAPNRWAKDPRFAQPGDSVEGGRYVPIDDVRVRGQWRAGAEPTVVGSRELPTDPRGWTAGDPRSVYSRERVDARAVAPGHAAVVEPTALNYDPRDMRTSGGTREAAPAFLLESLISQQRPLEGVLSPEALTFWMKRRALGWHGEIDGAPVPQTIQRPPLRLLQMLARHPQGGPVLAWANQFNAMLDAYARAGHRVVAT